MHWLLAIAILAVVLFPGTFEAAGRNLPWPSTLHGWGRAAFGIAWCILGLLAAYWGIKLA